MDETTAFNADAHRAERRRRVRDAEIQGFNLVYLCKNHDWYVGTSEASKKLHLDLRQCEALPTDIKEAITMTGKLKK